MEQILGLLVRRTGQTTRSAADSKRPESPRASGEWFREALRRFHYSIPEHSQKYLRPILFHAGIPAASIKGTLEVIADSCKRYRSETEHLPFDLREDCVTDKPQLHKSVRELFSNKLLGAAELWRSLARVVYAKVYRGNCELELSELPSVISRQHIEAFFEREHIKGISRSSHLAMARLVYSVEDGAVRIILPPYSRTRYLLKSGDSEIDGFFGIQPRRRMSPSFASRFHPSQGCVRV